MTNSMLFLIRIGIVTSVIGSGYALAQPRHARLEPSIVCRTGRDYELMSARIRTAEQLGCRHPNFVFTVNCTIDDQDRVTSYGLRSRSPATNDDAGVDAWRPMTDELLAELAQYYKEGLRQANAANMRIAILCHLDVGEGPYTWRNYFRFDPLVNLNGYSYADVLIDPLLVAIQAEVPAVVPIDISIAGEMGQSVFAHANSYAALAAKIRKSLPERQIQVGISFNFNNVVGMRDSSQEPPFTATQKQEVQSLLNRCDFIGFSNYYALSVPPQAEDFRRSIAAFADDLAKHDVKLRPNARLHFSEIGLGGYGRDGFTTDPEQAAETPYNGPGVDLRDPWQNARMREFRVAYHRALLKFLSEQGAAWPVDVAYLWTDKSWDPQGIDQQQYADDEIIRMIQVHNRRDSDR